jgi:hypothetical protein
MESIRKTDSGWNMRDSSGDLPTGPRRPKVTVLSIEQETIAVAALKHAKARRSQLQSTRLMQATRNGRTMAISSRLENRRC